MIATTIAGDAASKVLNNTINDPNYVKNHYVSWRSVWEDFNNGKASVEIDDDTGQKISNAINNKFIGGEDSLGDLQQSLLNGIFDRLKFIIEPIQVNYSNEILSNQIYDISVILFIFSLLIFGLILVLLLNIILYINMDRIIKFFNNKFIHWYLLINKNF